MKKRHELTDKEIREIEGREHQVTITLPGVEYLDIMTIAELKGLTVPEYVRDVILERRLLTLDVAARRAEKKKDDDRGGGMH